MIIPLDKLLQKSRNIYELTNAVIKRASQLTITGAKEIDEEGNKIVSIGMKQVLTGKVEFRRED